MKAAAAPRRRRSPGTGSASPAPGCRAAAPSRCGFHRFADSDSPDEIDDGVGALERGRPRAARCRPASSPTRVIPGTPVPGSCRVSPDISDRVEHADVVTLLRVHLRERTAEKPRAAGDNDFHRRAGLRPDSASLRRSNCTPLPITDTPSVGVFDERRAKRVCTKLRRVPREAFNAPPRRAAGPWRRSCPGRRRGAADRQERSAAAPLSGRRRALPARRIGGRGRRGPGGSRLFRPA